MSTSFFSYSRADQDFAMKLADDLRENGIEIWFDQFHIPTGALWDLEIEKALKNCDTLIVIISTNSVKSKNVLDEISYAIEENKRIIPVKISSCEIPFRIRRLQYIEFTKNYQAGLNALLKSYISPELQTSNYKEKKKEIYVRKKCYQIFNNWVWLSILLLIILAITIYKFNLKGGSININPQTFKDSIITKVIDSNSPTEKDTANKIEPKIKNINTNILQSKTKENIDGKKLKKDKIINGYVSNFLIEFTDYYYSGNLKNGVPDGNGKLFDKNSNLIYEGNFANGSKSGFGKSYQKGKLEYVGNWQNNLFNGKGIVYENNYSLNGNWNNSFFLEGVLTFSDGTKLIGKPEAFFYNDDPVNYGKARIEFLNGDVFEGQMKNCKFSGFGTYSWSKGSKFSGDFLENKINGDGVFNLGNQKNYNGKFTSISDMRVNFDDKTTKQHLTFSGIIIQSPPIIIDKKWWTIH